MAEDEFEDEEKPSTGQRNALVFDFSNRKVEKAEPLDVEILFPLQDAAGDLTGETELVTFKLLGRVGAAGQMAIAGLNQADETGRRMFNPAALYGFYKRVMNPVEYQHFCDTLDRWDIAAEMEELTKVTLEVVNHYGGGRPTRPSSSSSRTGSSTGRQSTVRALPKGRTSQKSRS